MAPEETLPRGLTQRNVDPDRKVWARLVRYVLIGVLVVLLVVAASNALGQHPSTSVAENDAARLSVFSPSRVRGGLLFTTRFRIEAKRRLQAATLVLDPGWFEGMQVNSIVPQPRSQSSHAGKIHLDLGPIARGDDVAMFVEFQVNPTNVGSRAQDVRLDDAGRQLLVVHRRVTVLP